MREIKVRKANQGDARDVFEWRNDEQTRNMSRTSSALHWEDHLRWFTETLQDTTRLMIVCEDASTFRKVGVVRFDSAVDELETVVSINIAPTMRGSQGYAKVCLVRAIEFFLDRFPACKVIWAEIRNSNEGSIRSFEGVGFVFTSADGDFGQYRFDCPLQKNH